MFSSLKNTELLRYFVRVDLNKGIDKIIKQNASNFSIIAGSIFSGSFSVLGTYFGMHTTQYETIVSILCATSLFSILFVIGMLIFQLGIRLLSFIYNARKKEHSPSKVKTKQLIDDFDHIACDNILISQRFIQAYNDSGISNNIKEFYFYEIIYYTKVSLGIIKKIFVNDGQCINDKNHTNRIHLFRLDNSIKMLDEIYRFLENNQENICKDNNLHPSLEKEIEDIEETIKSLKEKLENFKTKHYPQETKDC